MEWLEEVGRQFDAAAGWLATTAPKALLAIIVFVVLALVARVAARSIRFAAARLSRHENLGLVLGRLARWVILLLGVLVGVTIVFPSFKPGDLIQLLGIGSVAIGFAFRDILQNFLAGVLILLTEPFRIGDQIVFQSFEGTVEDIQTRATAIRTYDGRRVVIPNANLFTNAVTVNTAYEHRRLEYDIGIGVADDADRAQAVVLDELTRVDGVLADPAPDALVMDLAASSVVLRVRWWIRPPRRADALDARDRVLRALKRRLTAEGIDLPFATSQILFHDQSEEADGDRRRQREGWPPGSDPPRPRTIAGAIERLADRLAQR